MKNALKLILLLSMVFVMIGCEDEDPDYAADIIGKYTVESYYDAAWDETFDYTGLAIDHALVVEITRDEINTYYDDEVCETTYETETDDIDGVTETAIVFSGGAASEYSFVDGKLRIDDGGDIIILADYDGVVPPAVFSNPSLATNDTYEPDNQMSTATTIAAGGTIQNHYISECEDIDYFMFPAVAGTRYMLATTTPTESELDLFMTLYDASGNELESNDDWDYPDYNPGILWTCPATGDYYFLIEPLWDDESGNYSVSVVESTGLVKTVAGESVEKTQPESKLNISDLFDK